MRRRNRVNISACHIVLVHLVGRDIILRNSCESRLCPNMSQARYPHLIRNAVCLGLDNALFGASMLFVSRNTVLPTFARQLTDSTVLLGLVASIATGGWMLPQLFAARLVAGRARVKPYVVWPGLALRITLWVTGIITLLFAATKPGLTLVVFLLLQLVLWIGVGISGLSWFDLFAKQIPPERRGRVLGVSQTLRGLIAIAVGFAVAYLLGPGSPATFPLNYALLFFGAGAGAMVSFAAVALVLESPECGLPRRTSLREYLPKLWSILRTDPAFSRLMAARILVGYSTMAYVFYIIFATENLALSPTVIGSFTLAQTIGSTAGGLVLGYANERKGSLSVIRLTLGASLAIPIVALLTHFAGGALGSAVTYVYLIVFVLIGVADSSFMLGFMNCLIEIAPPTERPIYLGLSNTGSAVILLAPLVGGWILQVSTYPVLFLISAICAGLAFVPASALIEPRTLAREAERQKYSEDPRDPAERLG